MRKVREVILAAEIERRYTKDEILELYLNEIYYGNLAYGIEAAAETYFGKTAGDSDPGRGSLPGRPAPGALRLRHLHQPRCHPGPLPECAHADVRS